jgi:hypothetical protein
VPKQLHLEHTPTALTKELPASIRWILVHLIEEYARHNGQAQSPPAPYIALWNRIPGLDLKTVDQAFADRSLVKASLMRITLHAVDATDHPAFHAASTPLLRAARLNDRRYRSTGLT